MPVGLFRRFVWGTLAGLVLSSLVFLVLYVGMYRGELAQERASAVENINRLLWASLENAMLKADVEGIRQIIRSLGQQPGIVAVNVTNPQGEIRFASDEARIGEPIGGGFFIPASATTQFVTDANGVEALRSIIPVPNREACVGCHGSVTANPVNGVLLVDYAAEPLRRKAQRTTLLLMGAGALIVLLNLGGGWWFMRRFVLKPVSLLTAASERLRAGDLDAQVNFPGGDEFARLGSTFDDMARQIRRRVDELAEQRAFLQAMVDSIPDGLRVIDEHYRQVLVNRAYVQQLGATAPPVGMTCYASSHGRREPCAPTLLACPLVELAKSDQPLKTLHRHQRADGTPLDVEVYAAPMRIRRDGRDQLLVVESIRDLQSQVRYSHEQRLSELGKLAAGVAHEIYNPLSSLRLVVHAVRGQVERGDSGAGVRDNIDVLDHEIDRCIDITQRLLKLSNPPGERPEPVDFALAIRESASLLRWEAEQHGVRMTVPAESDAAWVMASDSALRMIAVNLIQNAIHALSARGGGHLDIRVQRRGGRIEAVFDDDGPGIEPEVLRHIFEPFFSRRADGVRGTGLGLSICRSLADQYGGEIRVESEVGKGARFIVGFPDPEHAAQPEKWYGRLPP